MHILRANLLELRSRDLRITPLHALGCINAWDTSFSNVLPLEMMAPLSTAGTPPLFSYF